MMIKKMKTNNIYFCLILMLSILPARKGIAQVNFKKGGINTVNSAVPFLRIIPDARGGGMGDVGIGVSPDANSTYYNASKIPFSSKRFGFSLSYAPWLRALGITDIYLAHMAGFYKIGNNQSINSSLKFFSLGDINFTDADGNSLGNGSPRELAFDVGYSRKIGKQFGLGVAFRYIYSNLASGQNLNSEPIKAGHAFGADLSATHYKNLKVGKKDMKANITTGMTVSNLGTKISYSANAEEKDYIPTNFAIGTGFRVEPNKYNEIGVYADFNKLLVPTPDSTDANNDNIPDFKQKSAIASPFTSLFDAPGGIKEEFYEWTMGLGVEYWYDHLFAVRAGYFLEAKGNGNRQFFSTGVGVKYSVFALDFSYLIPTNAQRNPLDNTFRFTMKFDFAKMGGNKGDLEDVNPEADTVDKSTRKRMKKGK